MPRKTRLAARLALVPVALLAAAGPSLAQQYAPDNSTWQNGRQSAPYRSEVAPPAWSVPPSYRDAYGQGYVNGYSDGYGTGSVTSQPQYQPSPPQSFDQKYNFTSKVR